MEFSLQNLPTTVEQLTESSQQVLALMHGLFEDTEYRKAVDLCNRIQPLVEKLPESSVTRIQLQEMINKLRSMSVHILPDNGTFQLFESGIAQGVLDQELPLIERVRYRLSNVVLEKRDEFRRTLLRYLERNQQILTRTSLTIENRIVPGTVANWFLDYRQKIGGEQASMIERAQYITNDSNISKLSLTERQAINRLVDLIEYLKLSSYTPEGFEESVLFVDDRDGRLKLFENGRAIEIDSEQENSVIAQSVQKPVEDVKKTIPSQPRISHQPAVSQIDEVAHAARPSSPILDQLRKKYAGNPEGLRQEFYTAVQKKDRDAVIAVVYLLAEFKSLLDFIASDKKLNAFLTATWQKEFGTAVADEFKQHPTSVKSVRMFLRYILQKRVGIAEADAAKVGVQLTNVFVSQGKKEYTELAYFDMASKQFRWFE